MGKLVILSLNMLLAASIVAQKYSPTTTWPFLYEDFLQGTVYFSDKGQGKAQKLNIHLENVTLWHEDGDKILLSNPSGIERVIIGVDTFIYVNGELSRLVGAEGESALVELVKLDFKKLVSPSAGAYGMSTQASAANNRTSIGGVGYTQHIISGRTGKDKSDGATLPLIRKYFFIVGEKIIPASRREVEKSISKESIPTFRNIVKEKNIKWNDEKNLLLLLTVLQ